MKRFENKIALVTGAASGLGKAMAIRLAAEGAEVILADINSVAMETVQKEIKENTGISHCLLLDVSKQEEWQRALNFVDQTTGKLHVLINNAGFVPLGSIEDASFESFKSAMEVMVYGPFFGMQTFIPYMKTLNEPCAILNVSSVCGSYVATENNIAYNTAKSAVMGMTKAAAVDLAGSRIRVNVIHPGTIGGTAISADVLKGSVTKMKLSKIPMGRVGTPEEVASAVAYLCSDEAGYIHGASLVIDGGQILGYRDPKSY